MKTKILVVDDSLLERQLVEALLLRNPDYSVELAENGKDALRHIKSSPPDLVVTDLLMPEMNGHELVRHVRREHPDIPVIVMTAFGDERTALESLDAGAASYVPKSMQAERLIEAVDRVVEHARADRNRERLAQCALEYTSRYALDNDLSLIHALVDHTQQIMASQDFGDTVERIRIGEALEEALLNAMYHGNLEIDERELAEVRSHLDDGLLRELINLRCCDSRIRDRRIVVIIHLSPSDVRFVIRDQGRGFNAAMAESETSESQFDRGSHRGLTLIQSLMDEVTYNEHGNEMTMRKHAENVAVDGPTL